MDAPSVEVRPLRHRAYASSFLFGTTSSHHDALADLLFG
jgi:hypothetical protein